VAITFKRPDPKRTALKDFIIWCVEVLRDIASTLNRISRPEDWRIPAFLNGWLNYDPSWAPAGYYKDGSGRVHLRGLIKLGAVPSVIFKLDADCRPQDRELFGTISSAGGAPVVSRVDVKVDGDVVVDTGGNTWFSLNGISFRAALV
jgi:hypothetical protein